MCRKGVLFAGAAMAILLLNMLLNSGSVGLAQPLSTPTFTAGQIITLDGRLYVAYADNFETHQSSILYALGVSDGVFWGLIIDPNAPEPGVGSGMWVTVTGRVVDPPGVDPVSHSEYGGSLQVISIHASPEPTPMVTPTATDSAPVSNMPGWLRVLIQFGLWLLRLFVPGSSGMG